MSCKKQLTQELEKRSYRHISEHFGFSSTRNFHQSSPLPVPLTEAVLYLGRDRLQRLAAAAKMTAGQRKAKAMKTVQARERKRRLRIKGIVA